MYLDEFDNFDEEAYIAGHLILEINGEECHNITIE